MTFLQLRRLLRADLFRYAGELGPRHFFHTWRWEPGFRHTVLMRTTRYFGDHSWFRIGFYQFCRFLYQRASYRHGIHISPWTQIGGGLYLPHAQNIIINSRSMIGRNCNISQNVTIGQANRGPRSGTPRIGDRVYIAPGAVLFGAIEIGDDVAVGANCVVPKDVPPKAVVVGIPAQVISQDGSTDYVNHVWESTREDNFA